MAQRALIHVYDKTGLIPFVRSLASMNVQIISYGETLTYLQQAQLPVANLSHITGFDGMLGNSYMTFHSKIYAGILSHRDNPRHTFEVGNMGAMNIDMVVANLGLLSEEAMKLGHSSWDLACQIDLDTSTLIRAGAKNYRHVTVVTNPDQYEEVCKKLKAGTLDEMFRAELALRAFAATAAYEANLLATLAHKFRPEELFPLQFPAGYVRSGPLRHGENPHQQAFLYRDNLYPQTSVVDAQKLSSRNLSATDYLNMASAWEIASLFGKPTAVIVKHTIPCGVACDGLLCDAFTRALEVDPSAALGGTIAVNKILDIKTAEQIVASGGPWQTVMAQDYEARALDILTSAPEWGSQLNIMRMPAMSRKKGGHTAALSFKTIPGGIIAQQPDNREANPNLWRVVTEASPTPSELLDLAFALAIVRIVKSKAVVLATRRATVGIAAGQLTTFEAVLLALSKADEQAGGAVLAADDAFPDVSEVEAAAESGVTAIIQPGGSPRDEAMIAAANEAGIAMVFCQHHHYRH